MDNSVEIVPTLGIDAEDDLNGVDSMGRTQSIRPLLRTMVPHPRHGSTFTPRKDVGAMVELGCAPAVCWRILTTSNGVTARAVTMEPMEPERMRGMSADDIKQVDDVVGVASVGGDPPSPSPGFIIHRHSHHTPQEDNGLKDLTRGLRCIT